MIVCAYAVPRAQEEKLRELGVKDSKQLSAKKREELAAALQTTGHYALVEATASDLNTQMKRLSLNDIEARLMAEALTQLTPHVGSVTQVFIDTPDPVLSTFERRLRRYYHGNSELVCAHKADQTYPVVSAASILAKVTRDASVARIATEIGENVGTGYSHDERTLGVLKKHWTNKAHPVHKYVRQEWATAKNLQVLQFKLDSYL